MGAHHSAAGDARPGRGGAACGACLRLVLLKMRAKTLFENQFEINSGVPAQVDTMLSALEAAREIAANRAGQGGQTSAAGKLGDAIGRENDDFISGEGDQQQLLMR